MLSRLPFYQVWITTKRIEEKIENTNDIQILDDMLKRLYWLVRLKRFCKLDNLVTLRL